MGCHPSHLDFHIFQRGRYTTNIHQPVKDLTFIQTTGSFPVAPSVQASRWWQRWGIGNPKKNHRSGLVWLWIDSDLSLLILACHIIPIGSMYGIYGNNYHQYTPNVSIYTIHGSYGISYHIISYHAPMFVVPISAGNIWTLKIVLRLMSGLEICGSPATTVATSTRSCHLVHRILTLAVP